MHQTVEHMEEYNLFSPIEPAYHTKNNTETALLKILNGILLALYSGKGVIIVIHNLPAAFDHDILVSRLQTSIGIEGPALP